MLLVTACWASGLLFGMYILIFFGGNSLGGVTYRWNAALAGLHDLSHPSAIVAMGTHFVAGGVLMVLGPIQLIGRVRTYVSNLHRWLGRAYVLCAGGAGVGGLVFIADEGTIGGIAMDVGFGLYGASMVTAAAMTFRFARQRRLQSHREWAIRLYALTVGSWLYRMEYALWFTAVGRAGHTEKFTGWFDRPMMFLFYIPNLVVAEIVIRGRSTQVRPRISMLVATVVSAGSLLVIAATHAFAERYWMPGILNGLRSLRLDVN